MTMKKPRYTKAGTIYKQDRDMIEQGWPETIEPGSKPRKVAASDPRPAGAGLPVPDPMKRKGRC